MAIAQAPAKSHVRPGRSTSLPACHRARAAATANTRRPTVATSSERTMGKIVTTAPAATVIA